MASRGRIHTSGALFTHGFPYRKPHPSPQIRQITEGDTTCSTGSSKNGSVNGTAKNGTNGVHRDVAVVVDNHDLGWDALPPAVTRELDSAPIDPALVSHRKGRGGKTFSYIEGHVAIAEANRVFGFGGWAYELAGDVTLREIETIDPRAPGRSPAPGRTPLP